MCGTAMRGADALPGSKATSRAKGSYRNLGDLISDPLAMCLNGPCREGEEPTPAMYGGEKSDRAIVAMKPANKAKRSAAESVERRAREVQFQRYTRVGRSAGVGAPIAGLLRVVDPPSPKVGAVCGKAARTVLCGGRSAKASLPRLHFKPAICCGASVRMWHEAGQNLCDGCPQLVEADIRALGRHSGFDPEMECALDGGQFQAAFLTGCWAWRSSYCAGLI